MTVADYYFSEDLHILRFLINGSSMTLILTTADIFGLSNQKNMEDVILTDLFEAKPIIVTCFNNELIMLLPYDSLDTIKAIKTEMGKGSFI